MATHTSASMTDREHVDAMDQESAAAPAPAAGGDLVDLYSRWFDVVPADAPDLVRTAYRLRFQVYCVENRFENAAQHPDGLESDKFDSHSVHSLLIHRPTGMVAGAVRLILPRADVPGCGLPIASLCTHPDLRDPTMFPPTRTAEISRFAVSKAFRRRITDAQTLDMHILSAPTESLHLPRITPHITLGLMKAVAQMGLRHGITHMCAVMEPSLLRLIRRLGIDFTPIGGPVAHHGLRQPCYSDLTTIGNGLLRHRPDAMTVISDRGTYWEQVKTLVSSG